jgi:hypothetical protein
MPPPPAPEHRFTRHGRLRVSGDRTHLAHADGTPFFYLADTAWNGPLLSTDADWQAYLADRAAKGFTAIQFITHAPWSAAMTNLEGQTAWTNDPKHPVSESFFDRIDRRIAEINAAGLLAVPVLAWAANFGASARLNIGHTATADDLIPLLRYQLDRFAKRHCLFFLAGDAHYTWWRSRKWKKVARALFTHSSSVTPHPSLITLHPAGLTWPFAHFKDEPWLDLYAYQSSHSEDPRTLNWLHAGPPATFWKKHPRPTINVEPVYEDILGRNGPFTADAVRRAAYASLLNAPTAGVAYGAHGLWGWHDRPTEALNHNGLGVGQPWRVAMNLPGSHHMGHLAGLMTSINWWTLRPDSTLVTSQTSSPHPVSAARSATGDLALVYFPTGQPLALDRGRLKRNLSAMWFNPRTGERAAAAYDGDRVTPPDSSDWLLLFS